MTKGLLKKQSCSNLFRGGGKISSSSSSGGGSSSSSRRSSSSSSSSSSNSRSLAVKSSIIHHKNHISWWRIRIMLVAIVANGDSVSVLLAVLVLQVVRDQSEDSTEIANTSIDLKSLHRTRDQVTSFFFQMPGRLHKQASLSLVLPQVARVLRRGRSRCK